MAYGLLYNQGSINYGYYFQVNGYQVFSPLT